MHDDIVAPVHGEVGDIDRPQWPVTHKLSPVHIVVIHLKAKQHMQ